MSKPSASGRRRNEVFITGHGWTYIPDGKYHRHNLGGGNALKAVTRARRAAASRQIGQGRINQAAQERRALATLLRVAEEIEQEEAA